MVPETATVLSPPPFPTLIPALSSDSLRLGTTRAPRKVAKCEEAQPGVGDGALPAAMSSLPSLHPCLSHSLEGLGSWEMNE